MIRNLKNVTRCLIFCFAFMTVDAYAGLTDEQIDDFHKKGYVILPKFYSDDEVARMQQAQNSLVKTANELGKDITEERKEHKIMANGTQYVLEKNGDETKIKRFVGAGGQESSLTELGRKSEILDIMHQLLGTEEAVDIIRSLHIKQWHEDKKDRLEFIHHQDIENREAFSTSWKEVPDKEVGKHVSYVAICAAIQPMHENNGPLEFISGIPMGENNRPINLHLKKTDMKIAEEMVSKYGTWEKLTLNPGDIVLQHPFWIHRSGHTQVNDFNNQRGLLIIGMCRPDANPGSYPGERSGEVISLRGF